MSGKLKAAVVGLGFIGPAHVDALRRSDLAVVEAVVSRSQDKARQFAERFGIPRIYGSMEELLRAGGVDVVHNCTPNLLHFPINRQVLEAGLSLYSEKPLTMNAVESLKLVKLAARRKAAAGVNFNYRMFPMAVEARRRIERGELGRLLAVQAEYIQDWLILDTDYDWRMEPEMAGPTRAVGDIGTHAADLLFFLTGRRIQELAARLKTVYPVRRRPVPGTDGFEEVRIASEDYADMLLNLEGELPGTLTVSQVTAGRKNGLHVRIDGEQGSLDWHQEDPNRLYIGRRSGPNEVLMRDPALLSPEAACFTVLPGGHEEGYADALRNAVNDFYGSILEPGRRRYTATLYDGYMAALFNEAAVESHSRREWVRINPEPERSSS